MWFFKDRNKETAKEAFPKPPERGLENMHAYRVSDDARKTIEDGNMRLATVADYADWLQAHLKAGGHVTEHYQHDMRDTLIVGRSVNVPPLHGAESLCLIVPDNVMVNVSSGKGHNEIYYYGDVQKNINAAPIYDDVKAEMLKRGVPEADLSPKPKSNYTSNNGMGFMPGTAAEKFKAATTTAEPTPVKELTQAEKTAAVVASMQDGLAKDVTVKPIRLRMKSTNLPTT